MSNFKQLYLQSKIQIGKLDEFISKWHSGAGNGTSLQDFLGLSDDDMGPFLRGESELKKTLDAQKRKSIVEKHYES